MTAALPEDLAGARIFRIADSDSAERWYVTAEDTVIYQRANGELERDRVILTAGTLQRQPTWVEAGTV